MKNPIIHFEIMGPDGEKLRKFYEDAFGWTIQVMPGDGMDYGMLDGTEGPGIGGGIGTDPSGQARVSVYVEVDDPDAYLKKVESAGGEVIMPTSDVPGGPTIAMFKDPQGNITGLVKANSMG